MRVNCFVFQLVRLVCYVEWHKTKRLHWFNFGLILMA
nr:MAG TPA: hypothetical protein [Caudoviricetes sp.]